MRLPPVSKETIEANKRRAEDYARIRQREIDYLVVAYSELPPGDIRALRAQAWVYRSLRGSGSPEESLQ